ncbi:MAG: DUF2207 domain-containing protein, partial [Propionibacteriaceae bacterium]|nr:DUF2207 domain-containing protein [Propionibacteriaceae bacterium]
MSRVVRSVAAALVAVCLLSATAAPAHAADQAESMEVKAQLSAAGVISVTETLSFAAPAPATVVQSFALAQDQGGRDALFDLTDLQVTASGAAATVTDVTASGVRTLTVETGGATEITISYQVRGATFANPDGTVRAAWNVLQGLSVPVGQVTGTFDLPPGVLDYICEGGVAGATRACGTWQGGLHGAMALSFTDGPRAAGDVLQAGAQLQAGAVAVTAAWQERWSLGRAFSLGWGRIGLAAAMTAVGCLALLAVWRRFRSRLTGARPDPVAEFAVDQDGHTTFTVAGRVRPGLVGTLIDQSVDPSDILASLLDLAQRGHLRITELPRFSASAVPDWTLQRREGAEPLEDYERELLDAVAPLGAAVAVSSLGGAIAPAIGQVQDTLYRSVVGQGWFTRHPAGRNRALPFAWAGVGVAVLAAAGLVVFTTWGLVGLALVAVALVGWLVAQESPVLSAKGGQVMAGLGRLSADLHNVPIAIKPGDEYTVASAVLPYAIVLGGWDRWLGALVAGDLDADADPEDLDWYHAPGDWHLSSLPQSLDA